MRLSYIGGGNRNKGLGDILEILFKFPLLDFHAVVWHVQTSHFLAMEAARSGNEEWAVDPTSIASQVTEDRAQRPSDGEQPGSSRTSVAVVLRIR